MSEPRWHWRRFKRGGLFHLTELREVDSISVLHYGYCLRYESVCGKTLRSRHPESTEEPCESTCPKRQKAGVK